MLFLIGFVQNTQFDIDRWTIGLDQTSISVKTFELPATQGLIPIYFKTRLDDSMRSGIPNEIWGGVITIYKDGLKIQKFTGNENPNNSRLVLASKSPRRRELLKEISNQFEVAPSSIKEVLDIGLRPAENARNIARAKAESIAPSFPNSWVIGADTLVTLDDEIFGKPDNEKDAERILTRLNGREHIVVTGICVVGPEKSLDKFVVSKIKYCFLKKRFF